MVFCNIVKQRLIDEIILYILYTSRPSIKYKYPLSSIMAMYETSVWIDMVSINKQRAKSVCLKTTGHEKCMVSACIAAKEDGTKLKPFAVFCEAKQRI